MKSGCLVFVCTFFLFGGMGCRSRTEAVETIRWSSDLPAALESARDTDQPVLVLFTASWCPSCRRLKEETLSDPRVLHKMRAFRCVRIDVDTLPDVANAWGGNARKYGGVGIPNVLFLDADGRRLYHMIGFKPPEGFEAVLDSVLGMIRTVKDDPQKGP